MVEAAASAAEDADPQKENLLVVVVLHTVLLDGHLGLFATLYPKTHLASSSCRVWTTMLALHFLNRFLFFFLPTSKDKAHI